MVLAARVVLDRTGLAPSEYRLATADTDIVVYAVILASAIVCACWPARRRAVLAAGGAIGLSIALHAWVLPLFGYMLLAIVLARLAIPIAARFAIAIAAWLVVPAMRVAVFEAQGQADTILLALWWVGQLYACLYLIVERARALPGEATTVIDDACYLVAPARLVIPFFQPISPRDLFERERPSYSWRLIGRGAALGAYGLALGVIAQEAPHLFRGHGHALHTAGRFIAAYARAAHAIVLAIATFRLLGFSMRPGFRWPFLSRSFAELFRRYNFYVRDAVVSLFYMPILGHVRHRLPRRAASIVAAFTGILIGSFLLQDLLIPCGVSIDPADTLATLLRPHRILTLLTFWCLIVIPNAGIIPRRREPVGRLRAAFQVVLVAATFVALWYFEGE